MEKTGREITQELLSGPDAVHIIFGRRAGV